MEGDGVPDELFVMRDVAHDKDLAWGEATGLVAHYRKMKNEDAFRFDAAWQKREAEWRDEKAAKEKKDHEVVDAGSEKQIALCVQLIKEMTAARLGEAKAASGAPDTASDVS